MPATDPSTPPSEHGAPSPSGGSTAADLQADRDVAVGHGADRGERVGGTSRRDRQRRLPLGLLAATSAASLLVALLVANLAVGDDGDGGEVLDVSDLVQGGADGDLRGPAIVDPASVEPGDLAPTETFALLDGGTGSMSDFRGTPVLVNFYASWCVPCRAEMPAVQQVHDEAADDLVVVGFNVAENTEVARAFAEEVGVDYPLATDPRSAFLHAFGGSTLPYTAVVDADGVLVRERSGVLDLQELRDMVDEVS